MVWCGGVMPPRLLARVPFAPLGLLRDHLVFQPFADELDWRDMHVRRKPAAPARRSQYVDDDEHQISAAEQAFIRVRHRRVVPKRFRNGVLKRTMSTIVNKSNITALIAPVSLCGSR